MGDDAVRSTSAAVFGGDVDPGAVIWRPRASATVDASELPLERLTVWPLDAVEVSVRLPRGLAALCLSGDLGRIELDTTAMSLIERNDLVVTLAPTTSPHPDASPLAIPPLPAIEAARRVCVRNVAGRQPVDLEGLGRWTMLRTVTIEGSVTGLGVLADLPALRSLELSAVDDLDGLPDPADLDLDHLAARDVEAAAGAALRDACRDLGMPKAAPDSYRGWTISDLRSRSWFERTFRLPFVPWPEADETIARRAFKAAEREIVGADVELARDLLRRFGAEVSRCDALGAAEWADVRAAYDLLLEAAGLDLPEDRVDRLFADTRRG